MLAVSGKVISSTFSVEFIDILFFVHGFERDIKIKKELVRAQINKGDYNFFFKINGFN